MKFPNLIKRTVDSLLAEIQRPSTARFDLVERFAQRVPCHACLQSNPLPWRKDTEILLYTNRSYTPFWELQLRIWTF